MTGRRRLVAIGILLLAAALLPMTTMAFATTPVARMGDTLDAGGWSYRVVSFERLADPLPDRAPALTVDDSDILGVIVLDAWNNSGRTTPMDLDHLVLRDASGRIATVVVDPEPKGYLVANDFASGTSPVAAGASARIALFFSIDPSWSFPTLELGDPSLEVRIDECHCQLPLPWLDAK